MTSDTPRMYTRKYQHPIACIMNCFRILRCPWHADPANQNYLFLTGVLSVSLFPGFMMKKKRTIIHYLPVYGSIATGIIYLGIGVIAILSFLKVRHGGADESSMLAILNDYIVGKILIWIILLGTVGYIAWRFYEAIKD